MADRPMIDGSADDHGTTDRRYVHMLALKVDPAWRRLPDAERARDGEEFLDAARRSAERVTTYTYSTIGTRADTDILFWRLAASLEELEETASLLLRTGLGRWSVVAHSMIGLVRPSNYVKERTPQEQAMFTGERSRYIIVYPFVKSTEWYLMSETERRRQMSEHIKIGRQYPMVQQLLAYSFGLDDQEFIVAYETDDLPAFQDLVRDLRATEGRRVTVRDTPQLVGVNRPLDGILSLLGQPA
jgi:chlorite dismutase